MHKMPRPKANSSSNSKPVEPEKSIESEEQVDLDENMEEEVEYEEIEEEVEEDEEEDVQEEEEVEEDVEEDVEEEEEEDEEEEEEEAAVTNGGDGEVKSDSEDVEVESGGANDAAEHQEHAELLALPPHGSEVYLGGIPHDVTEEDLKGFCESIGEVTEVRIMKGKDSSENKGYAFVTFRTKELASKAIEDLNNTEFKGRKIKCSTSQAKHRLFIGNVPRSWAEADLRKVVKKVGPGVTTVELLKDPQNSSRNRGFAFIEYYNHACAEYSRQKMSNPQFKLDNNAPTVSWADPKSADSSPASQVKAVYVKNLPKNVTQDQLKHLFERHGEITKIVLPPAKAGQEKSRFGFVHFAERSSAMKALKNTEKYELEGQVLDCSLAKPQASDRKPDSGPNTQKAALIPNFPRVGYGLPPYGAFGAGYGAAGFAQPMIYGRGPTPAGMAMVPMLLPDGRLGYVLQQPGAPVAGPPPPSKGGNRGGSGSSGSRQNNDNNGRGRRYRPY
ncbi:heterogeneous nuclear ribonucleoprotein Q-like [Aristolochia californica]|uniref:heterogeneous nuclear ribonucleoprotein Q-like n=1 Tax=Aristolochia californica TaxID=171875 RepID=UPI0035E333F3